ncbi:CZB domain-containing protein [Formivibrio citricus]
MRELLGLSDVLQQSITGTALHSFCDLAKLDHIIFKFRVHRVLLGQSDEARGNFSDHTLCRLGKWYYEGEGNACFSQHPAFRELEAPHKAVHAAAIAALEAHEQGDDERAAAGAAAMEAASQKVIAALDRMASGRH